MKSTQKEIDKIAAALIAAHRQQEETPLPPGWRQQVMESIRSISRPAPAVKEKLAVAATPRKLFYMAAGALAVVVLGLVLVNLDWYDPWINLQPGLTIVEKRAEFVLEAGDVDSGLKSLKVSVIQDGREVELISREFKQPEGFWWSSDATKKVEIPLVLDPEKLNLQEGPAAIQISARDLSLRNWFQGRLTVVQRQIFIHLKKSPPDQGKAPGTD